MKKMKRTLASALIFVFMSSLVPANVFAASSKGDSENDLKDPDVNTASIGKIVGEVTDKREKTSKTYRLDNGTFEVSIYDTAVHYLDSQGTWKDIDNSFIDAKDEKGNDVLKNKENSFNVEISKNVESDKLVKIKKDGYELSWSLVKPETGTVDATEPGSANILESMGAAVSDLLTGGSTGVSAAIEQTDEATVQRKIDRIAFDKAAKTQGYDKLSDEKKAETVQIAKYNEDQKTLKKVNSSVKFSNILKDVDISYTIEGDAVKEDITIAKTPEIADNLAFMFNLKTNLTPQIDSNKNIVFYNEKNTAVYIMQTPFMYDANKESSDDIDVVIDKGTDGYLLTVRPDANWIRDEKRVYPVTIDPSVSTPVDVKTIKDAFVSSAQPEVNYYNSMFLKTGYGSASAVDRTFIKFALPQLVPSDMVTGAWLDLACNTASGSQVDVHEVLGDWDSTNITWNNKPSYNSVIEDYQMVTLGDEYYSWDITNIAKKWYSENSNNGLMLRAFDESGGYTEFISSDVSDEFWYLRPVANIWYVNNDGLESYWTYHSADAGRAGTGYTNDFTGNVTFVHDTISANGNRLPINISHVYNSSDARVNDWSRGRQFMGAGWTLNVMQRVDRIQIGSTYYWVYTDEDGTKHYFVDSGAAELKDELNLGYTFSTDLSGYRYIKDKSDNKVKFYWDGSLCSFIDNTGSSTQTEWSIAPGTGVKTLTSLTDGSGNKVTRLSYDDNGVLLSVTDPSGRATTFSYDTESFQKLTKIKYPDNLETTFTYDSNYRLISATNIDNRKISYEYYSYAPYRVKKVWESNDVAGESGNELNFSYGNNVTTMTDTENRKNIIQFNNSGKTVCVLDADGNASYSDYADSSNISKNTLESKLQKTQINHILNHNMEADSNWSPTSWSGAAGTQTFTMEEKYMGNRSMKINSTSINGGLDFEQSGIQLEKGSTYTISSYIKTIGLTTEIDKGAAIFVGYKNASGAFQYFKKYINGSKDWHREELQFTIPLDAQSGLVFIGCEIEGSEGTAYFDCLQLESGNIANRYNLIENPDFSYGTSFWFKNDQCNDWDSVTTALSDHPAAFDINGFLFLGQTDKRKNLLQTLNIPGKAGDTLVVGGWAKAFSAPIYGSRNFSLTIGLKLPSGEYEWHDATFNTDSSQWQYLSKRIVANSDYTQIAYYLEYYNDVNSAMFDGIQLYKEEFGDSYAYDAKGNVVSTSDLAKQSSTFEYNGTNDLVKSTTPKGSQFTYEYDTKHNITKATSATGVKYSFGYDAYSNPMSSSIGDSTNGIIRSDASYTTDGNYMDTITDSSGQTIINHWNTSRGLINSVIDAAGNTTTYGYNEKTDNLESVSKSVDGSTITNEYGYDNDRIKSINHNGFSYNFGYDSLGNNTKVSIGDWNAANSIHLIENKYEERTGKLKSSTYGNSTDTEKQIVSFDYDNLDRIKGKLFNGIERFVYQYDGNGNLGYKEDKVDPQNIVKYRYIYDLADRLVKIVDSKGNSTSYEYEGADRSISQIKLWHFYEDNRKYHDVIVQISNDPTFSSGVRTVYNNDTDNSAELGEGTQQEYTETSSGWDIQFSPAKTRYVRFYSNGSTINTANHYVEAQVIDSNGNNIANGKSVTSSKAFTNSNRIVDGAYSDSYSYSDSTPNTGLQWVQIDLGAPNNVGNSLTRLVETLSGQTRSTSYEYDNDNRLSKVTLNNGSSLANEYDMLGRLTKKKLKDGNTEFSTTYNYVPGEDTNTTTTKVRSINNNGATISYKYDYEFNEKRKGNGNIAEIANSDGKKISYSYNELNEVIREDNEAIGKIITYSYDAGGNITNKTEYAYTEGDLGPATRTITYKYSTETAWKDKLIRYTTQKDGITTENNVGSDSIGNTTDYNGWTYSWEEGRQLETAKKGNLNISYKYDDSGIRTQKTINGISTDYHLVGDKVTYEKCGNNNIYYSYDSSDDLVSMTLNGTEYYYYIRNAQGDIIGLFDSNGAQVVSYLYDTWGNPYVTAAEMDDINDPVKDGITGSKANTVGVMNPYRYRGYRYDNETQLYYLQSRYYNPEWGRFISADSIAGETGELLSANAFAYGLNNPVNNIDSDGQMAIPLAAYAIELLIVGTATVSIVVPWDKTARGISEGYTWVSNQAKTVTKKVTDSLARSIPRNYRHPREKHHLVAQGHTNAEVARRILKELHISVDDPANLVYVKTSLHKRLHSNSYYGYANSMIIRAYNRGGSDNQRRMNVYAALAQLRAYVKTLDAACPW